MPVRVCVRACAQNLNRALRLILKSQMSHIHMYVWVCVLSVKNARCQESKMPHEVVSSHRDTKRFYFILFFSIHFCLLFQALLPFSGGTLLLLHTIQTLRVRIRVSTLLLHHHFFSLVVHQAPRSHYFLLLVAFAVENSVDFLVLGCSPLAGAIVRRL